jgi:diguanylate cyclase (GGDEF)-like protein/PAS domain S-box-containing protein
MSETGNPSGGSPRRSGAIRVGGPAAPRRRETPRLRVRFLRLYLPFLALLGALLAALYAWELRLLAAAGSADGRTAAARLLSVSVGFAAVLALAVGVALAQRLRFAAAREGLARERAAQLGFFQSAADSLPLAVFVRDRDGLLSGVNRAACELLGLPADELLGRRPEEFFAPEQAAVIRAADLKLETGAERERYELRRAGLDGVVRELSVHRARLVSPAGDYQGSVSAVVDLTELHETQRRLELSEERFRNWTQRLVTLNRMDDQLLACASLEEACETAAPFLERLLGAEVGAFYRFDATRDQATAVLSWGPLAESSRTFAGRECWAVRLAQPHGFEPGPEEPRCGHVESGLAGGAVCVPAFAASELQGILHLRFAGPLAAVEDPLALRQLAVSIASHLAIRFSAIGLRDAYRRQSTRDPLTDLFNRRYMEETLTRELRRCLRARESLAVLALDLDHFKSINDDFGHEAGDAVLLAVAAVLTQHSRVSDVACRAGGEEFIVLLPGMSSEAATTRAEAIRCAISRLRERRPEPAFARLTVSAGVALHPEHGVEPSELLRAADEALYRAKRGGRDRVELATGAG